MPDLPAVQIITYAFALWFGMYLLGKHFQKPGMRYTGLGLVAYALGLAIDTLRRFPNGRGGDTSLVITGSSAASDERGASGERCECHERFHIVC